MTVVAPLRRLVDCLDGQRVPLNSKERSEIPGDYPYWGANGVIDYVGSFLFNDELVLLGEDGAPFDEPMRDVAFRVTGRVWVNNHIHVLRVRPGTDSRFLTYALNAIDWTMFVSGSTRLKLTQEDMMRVAIPVPPLADQRAIADFLDIETARIDALVAKKRRMIELLDERLREVERSETLGANARRVPLRWTMRIGSGVGLQSSNLYDNPVGGVPVYGGNGLMGYTPMQSSVHEPSIAVGRVGALCGNVHLVDPPAWITDNALWVRDIRGFDREFLATALRATNLNAAADRTAQPLITGETVKKLAIPQPSEDEQKKIAEVIRAARNRQIQLSGRLGRQLDLLVERRHVLVTAAVTGGLEVPGVVG